MPAEETRPNDVASADGTRLALTTWGPPRAPLVVLVHGMGMSTSSWGDVPERLARSCRVVTYDLRGHGDSEPARDGSYELATHAADLGAVLDHVRSGGERATVLAHSLGGAILLEHAATTGATGCPASSSPGRAAPPSPSRGSRPAAYLPRWPGWCVGSGWPSWWRPSAWATSCIRGAGSPSG
ncbi:hypothetical protein A7K94_0213240 [Modestobacter sp. VKM Ac-2676]|nr:hypothetical protein A7K94_0213240 [Modestobacter sp. VKM Ac-2676]